MKISITNLLGFFLIIFVAGENKNFFPNLPMGEFKIYIKALLQCEPRAIRGFHYNAFLSKKTANTTEIKGNITLDMVFDNSFELGANFAVKDLIGGWKDNAHVIKIPNGCQSLKNLMGGMWYTLLKQCKTEQYDCPLRPGVCDLSSGLETAIFVNSSTNWPKVFFYGSYKAKLFTMKNNENLGCITAVADFKRPWELE